MDNGLSLGPLGYPVVLRHGDPAVLDLYIQSTHIPTVHRFSDYYGGPTHSPGSGSG